MFSATLGRRAEASMWSKSTLVSCGATDTLQYKISTSIYYLTIESDVVTNLNAASNLQICLINLNLT